MNIGIEFRGIGEKWKEIENDIKAFMDDVVKEHNERCENYINEDITFYKERGYNDDEIEVKTIIQIKDITKNSIYYTIYTIVKTKHSKHTIGRDYATGSVALTSINYTKVRNEIGEGIAKYIESKINEQIKEIEKYAGMSIEEIKQIIDKSNLWSEEKNEFIFDRIRDIEKLKKIFDKATKGREAKTEEGRIREQRQRIMEEIHNAIAIATQLNLNKQKELYEQYLKEMMAFFRYREQGYEVREIDEIEEEYEIYTIEEYDSMIPAKQLAEIKAFINEHANEIEQVFIGVERDGDCPIAYAKIRGMGNYRVIITAW